MKEIYLLVHFHTDSSLGDIPNTAGTSMVELVRHALVDGAVHLDVDVLADLEGPEVGGERDVTLLPEGTGEQVASSRSETVTGRHFRRLGFLPPSLSGLRQLKKP